MDNGSRFGWLDLRPIGLIAMAVAFVASTTISSATWKSVRGKPPARKLRITGSAKKRIEGKVQILRQPTNEP